MCMLAIWLVSILVLTCCIATLQAPRVPVLAEDLEMKKLINTYGKTFHTWQVDRGDTLPLGNPPDCLLPFVFVHKLTWCLDIANLTSSQAAVLAVMYVVSAELEELLLCLDSVCASFATLAELAWQRHAVSGTCPLSCRRHADYAVIHPVHRPMPLQMPCILKHDTHLALSSLLSCPQVKLQPCSVHSVASKGFDRGRSIF